MSNPRVMRWRLTDAGNDASGLTSSTGASLPFPTTAPGAVTRETDIMVSCA